MSSEDNYLDHISVMSDEVLDFLSVKEGGSKTYGDFTFGAGGHTRLLLNSDPRVKVIACDCDVDAFENAKVNFVDEIATGRLKIYHCNYSEVVKVLKEIEGFTLLDGVVLDLGVSTHLLMSASRGMSFQNSGTLDMRMNQRNPDLLTASEIVNSYPEEEIANIIYLYGEERLSRRIARNICELREETEIKTTKDLADCIFRSYPKKMRYGRIHPATKTFQALRIYINSELDHIEETIPQLLDILHPGSSICIISFHALEDRIVKHQFKKIKESFKDSVSILTKKPLSPTEEERNRNSRSRSAKMRVLKKNK